MKAQFINGQLKNMSNLLYDKYQNIKLSDIMKIAIVSGKSEGPTKLNAFDNALSDAGIGDVNLIKVSSMLAGNAEIQELPKLKAGSMVNCVLSEVTSSKPGAEITAVVAVAIMVRYMMEKRDVDIREMIIESSTATVENIASVVASVVYLKDEIIEG